MHPVLLASGLVVDFGPVRAVGGFDLSVGEGASDVNAFLINGDDSGELSFDYTNPVLGLRWQVLPSLQLHASAARGCSHRRNTEPRSASRRPRRGRWRCRCTARWINCRRDSAGRSPWCWSGAIASGSSSGS